MSNLQVCLLSLKFSTFSSELSSQTKRYNYRFLKDVITALKTLFKTTLPGLDNQPVMVLAYFNNSVSFYDKISKMHSYLSVFILTWNLGKSVHYFTAP